MAIYFEHRVYKGAPYRRFKGGVTVTHLTGEKLNQEWGVGAKHALYREDGKWYHHLVRFPGALFDKNGYILFRTREDYERCQYLDFGQDLNIPKGISKIPGYIRVRKT